MCFFSALVGFLQRKTRAVLRICFCRLTHTCMPHMRCSTRFLEEVVLRNISIFTAFYRILTYAFSELWGQPQTTVFDEILLSNFVNCTAGHI